MTDYSKSVANTFFSAFGWLGNVIEMIGLPLFGLEIIHGRFCKSCSKSLDAGIEEASETLSNASTSNADSLETADGNSLDDVSHYDDLRCILQYPTVATVQTRAFPNLSPAEICETIIKLVPDSVGWIAPRSNGTKALDFLVKSYTHGFPALPPAASAHCAEGVRLIVGALADLDSAGLKIGRAKILARSLAEAYTGCQAVQARTVDMLQGEIRGLTSQSLSAQLRVLIEEFREAALDRMVCHFHPGALTAGDGTPHLQLPHLANKYRRHLGSSIGISLSRMEAARSDRNASGPLPVAKELAEKQFWKEFDAMEICRAIVADVNQASEEAERRIDRRLLLEWCGSHEDLGYEVFYDESMICLYGDMKPSVDQEAMRQPFIHERFACQVLLSALGA